MIMARIVALFLSLLPAVQAFYHPSPIARTAQNSLSRQFLSAADTKTGMTSGIGGLQRLPAYVLPVTLWSGIGKLTAPQTLGH